VTYLSVDQELIALSSGLQNPDNKKEIICDDKFRAMFNVNKIDMFKMNKELSK
jgi:upstream activation factor subunit UAF30